MVRKMEQLKNSCGKNYKMNIPKLGECEAQGNEVSVS